MQEMEICFTKKTGVTATWNEDLQTWIRWETTNGAVHNVEFINQEGKWEKAEGGDE